MKILKAKEILSSLTASTADKQQKISVTDVFHLWNHLIQRYHIIYLTNIFENFAHDEDLRLILKLGKKTLDKHISLLEKNMTAYGIALPVRPPKQTQFTVNIEAFTDRYIFRRVLRGIQSFLPTHTMAFMHSTSPSIREMFLTFLIEELKLYDRFIEYGKLKSYVIIPPMYKTN
ncbi:hypothetical protein SPSYN_02558 [Sporotomaculum syntrophicum]|uniref:DUF3231 family protein n=1 Tax=Sporotomaculum syntrophicum TaxID=182264 RepID=A0A9D2WMY4_9FIRM|nr:DUF3231 family protein [Sporotomaculum syntrophicum]KAF1084154.1 hypothetical protein SPSYN_02558 [Sporotomaculum syntrophicum]